MSGHTTISIDNNFSSGQAAISKRTSNFEASGGIDVITGISTEPLGRQNRFDNQFHDAFANLIVADFRRVLSRQHHCFNADWFMVFINHGDLAFCIWPQPGKLAGFAHCCLTLHQLMRQCNRGGHQHVGFIAGIAEHQALVASALFTRILAVNSLCNVG